MFNFSEDAIAVILDAVRKNIIRMEKAAKSMSNEEHRRALQHDIDTSYDVVNYLEQA